MVQATLGFSVGTRRVVAGISLSGLTVLAEPRSADDVDELVTRLNIAGVPADPNGHGTVRFPLRHLRTALDADTVQLRPDPTLDPVVALLRRPVHAAPAVVDVDGDGDLIVTLDTHRGPVEFSLDAGASGALLATGVSFVATTPAWAVLRNSGILPDGIGVARVNVDGFIDITSPLPQVVEGAPLPGLFRLDSCRFGLALRFADHIDKTAGFRWHGTPPAFDLSAGPPSASAIRLSRHLRSDLQPVTDRLAADSAVVLAWQSGLGRRIMALAAVEALDDWPCTVVCPPSGLWAWQRHFDLVGRSVSVTHDRAEGRIVTYGDVARGVHLNAPAALILDDVCSGDASRPAVRQALTRFAGVTGMHRMALTDEWTDDFTDAVAILSLLRPQEFSTDVPLEHRYPAPSQQRAAEHVGAYLFRRRVDDPGSERDHVFRRSTVHELTMNDAQRIALRQLQVTNRQDPAAVLAEAFDITSAGPSHALSPKIATVVELADVALTDRQRVVVATRIDRTAQLLRALLRHHQPRLARAGDVDHGAALTIVTFDGALGDLRWADNVIVVDYPWSTTAIDAAVGDADEPGPKQVTLLHLTGSIDDRLAHLAARRREVHTVRDPLAHPTADELRYLLTGV